MKSPSWRRRLKGLASQSTYLRDTIQVFVTQLTVFILAFFSSVIVARTLGPSGKGALSLLILIPTTIAQFCSLGIDMANVYFIGSAKATKEEMVAISLLFTLAISTLGAVIYLPSVPLLAQALSITLENPLLMYAFLLAPLTLLLFYLNTILLGMQRISLLNLVDLCKALSYFLLNALLLSAFMLGIWGGLTAAIGGSLVAVLVALRTLGKGFLRHTTFSPNLVRKAIGYGMKGHIGNVVQFLNYRLDVFLVSYFLGVTQVGFYTLALTVAETLLYLPNAFARVLFPKIASSGTEEARSLTPVVARNVVFVTSILAFVLFLVGRPLVLVFYTDGFLPSVSPLWILLPGIVVLSLWRLLANDLAGRGRPEAHSVASFLSLFASVSVNLFLIPRWGIRGAAISSTLAYAIGASVIVSFYLRLSGHRLKTILLLKREDLKRYRALGGSFLDFVGRATGG